MISIEQIQNPSMIIITIVSLLLLIALAFLVKLVIDNRESSVLIEDLKENNESYQSSVVSMSNKTEELNKKLLEIREERLQDLKKIMSLENEVLRKESVIQQMQKVASEANAKRTTRKRPPEKEV